MRESQGGGTLSLTRGQTRSYPPHKGEVPAGVGHDRQAVRSTSTSPCARGGREGP